MQSASWARATRTKACGGLATMRMVASLASTTGHLQVRRERAATEDGSKAARARECAGGRKPLTMVALSVSTQPAASASLDRVTKIRVLSARVPLVTEAGSTANRARACGGLATTQAMAVL